MGAAVSSSQERILLCGPSGAGKDHDARLLREAGYGTGVSHTTRPPREGEVDGEDYHFVSDAFFDKVDFYETATHGIHRYGLSRREWDTKQVFVLNPDGVANVVARGDRSTSFVIYLNIPGNVRLVEHRGWTPEEIEVRATVDVPVFSAFTDYNLDITGDHDIVSIVRDILPH